MSMYDNDEKVLEALSCEKDPHPGAHHWVLNAATNQWECRRDRLARHDRIDIVGGWKYRVTYHVCDANAPITAADIAKAIADVSERAAQVVASNARENRRELTISDIREIPANCRPQRAEETK